MALFIFLEFSAEQFGLLYINPNSNLSSFVNLISVANNSVGDSLGPINLHISIRLYESDSLIYNSRPLPMFLQCTFSNSISNPFNLYSASDLIFSKCLGLTSEIATISGSFSDTIIFNSCNLCAVSTSALVKIILSFSLTLFFCDLRLLGFGSAGGEIPGHCVVSMA